MRQTLAEKILSRASGAPARPGQFIEAAPDWTFLIDTSVRVILGHLAKIGLDKLPYPERVAVFYDHYAPADNVANATDHRNGRDFARHQGITRFYDVGTGISHQVVAEKGLVQPGQLAFNTDSHTTTLGGLSCFGTGLGAAEMAYVWATGRIWLRVPQTIRVVLKGQLRPLVDCKDVMLTLLGKLSSRAAIYRAVEFHGDAIQHLPMASRLTLCNMTTEMGAKVAFVPFDNVTQEHYRNLGIDVDGSLGQPDDGATYEKTVELDLGEVVPSVACPHTVDNVRPAQDVKAVPIHQAFLGTCTNGRLEDLRAAAKVMKGRTVAAGVRMIVTPASRDVFNAAMKEGIIADLSDSGCVITTPGCGACCGVHMGLLGDSEVCISSGSRNFLGRMGNPTSSVYVASPATVAASAVVGHVIDPRMLV